MAAELIQGHTALIEILDQSKQVIDEDVHQALHGRRGTKTISIACDIYWMEEAAQTMTAAGNEEQSSGYIVVRVQDLKDKLPDRRLKPGDRIIELAGVDYLDLYIQKGLPFSHFPPDGPEFFQYFFKDRQPVQNRNQVQEYV